MSEKRKSILPGLIIIGIGVVLLLHNFRLLYFDWEIHFPLILAIIGVLLWVNAILKRDKGGVFPGTTLLIIGGFYYFWNIDVIPYYYFDETWPVIPLAIGIGFIASFLFKPKEWGVLIPGLIFTLIGIYFMLHEMFYVNKYVIDEIFSYWPVLLIITGTVILVNNLIKRSKEEKTRKIEG